jgi:WhiB family redox-sensing transcriptional regulator
MSIPTCRETKLPCQTHDPDLWFTDKAVSRRLAKALCGQCPVRRECLAAALERHEPWGVWGGEIIERGAIAPRRRPRGRPRKTANESPNIKCGKGFHLNALSTPSNSRGKHHDY